MQTLYYCELHRDLLKAETESVGKLIIIWIIIGFVCTHNDRTGVKTVIEYADSVNSLGLISILILVTQMYVRAQISWLASFEMVHEIMRYLSSSIMQYDCRDCSLLMTQYFLLLRKITSILVVVKLNIIS